MVEETPVQRARFHREIIDIYSNGSQLTARECAVLLKQRGVCKYGLRQESHPRIVELCNAGILEEVGSTIDVTTKKRVTIYSMKENEND